MTIKILGAVLIVAACAAMGYRVAAEYRKEVHTLQQLQQALEYMKSQLSFSMPALSDLCRQTADRCTGVLKTVFFKVAEALESGDHSQAEKCMNAALKQVPGLSSRVRQALMLLGSSMGRFDLSGQLSGIHCVYAICQRDLEGLYANQDQRIRSYQTLGLCAGAALVIIFV